MASTLPGSMDCCSPCQGETVTVTGETSVIAVGVFAVDTVADLRGLTSVSTNELAYSIGNLTKEDAMGGWYTWESLSTDADDGIMWIKPNDLGALEPGRWRKRI